MEINRTAISDWLKDLQNSICSALEKADGGARFTEDIWTRPEGGGGVSRILANGRVIEKGGVLFSAVEGKAPEFLLKEVQSTGATTPDEYRFYATGVSIVLHPKNPMVPIIHMNIRYFEMGGDGLETIRWLGGGIDLTPHYISGDDAKFFHQALKTVCDKCHSSYYPKFKKWADDYFYIQHRGETRGIGGIFFDKLNSGEVGFEQNLQFWKDLGSAFAPIYTELIRRNQDKPFTENNKQWQLLRRGRYVEFNLVYDRGTKFGLETNGRVESILMSLPALAAWTYDYKPEKGSDEEKTLGLLKKNIDWLA